MKTDSVVEEKSKAFAIRIIKLYKYLNTEKNESIMSKQILRSGTSIGANIKEAHYAQSRPDFYSKLKIALKEAAETEYWLELFKECDYIEVPHFESIYNDCKELVKLLTSIAKNN